MAKVVRVDDLQSHADLALAYAEMGLRADAMREAAIALARPTESGASKTALRVLFRGGLMKPHGLRALKRRLGR